MADGVDPAKDAAQAMPGLAQLQHWTRIIGQAQQLIMEKATALPAMPGSLPSVFPSLPHADLERIAAIQADAARDGMAIWQRFLAGMGAPGMTEADSADLPPEPEATTRRDRRFADPAWKEHPLFDLMRQTYLVSADALLRMADSVDGLDGKQKEKLRFSTRALVDAVSPSNFALTNPKVLARAMESRGESLLKGLEHMLADVERGQLTHADGSQFEVGRNLAATSGKVVHETPLYQLIHYAPTTETVLETPLIIFPPWINRFYILDLSPEKSFVRWAVEQGISVFMVSWKSADASMADVVLDDYVKAQIDAIDTVRDLLDVPAVHTIGYCVAGTTLAATLAVLAARAEAGKVASVTFFTAQVDFSEAGDLTLFVDDEQIALIESLSTDGFLDGRYMAATFNLLRGNDLIWSYVVNNYLLGDDYPPFDLLYWNGDTTNLPVKWHRAYLSDFYRDNRLAQPDSMVVDGTPVDLRRIRTPAYIQAGAEDHIAPPQSVWKITHHLSGPMRFVLAGSGHIAGVVNPPSSGKYQYWTCAEPQPTLDAFRAAAIETKGSWWPDWLGWIVALHPARVPAKKARKPGKGKAKAIENAPGRYVQSR
jgi:polyhydroxyalkanoate synthase subunit PhaC